MEANGRIALKRELCEKCGYNIEERFAFVMIDTMTWEVITEKCLTGE